ncbi:hypothetical protein CTP10_R32360 [Cupriavidus sp. P-10]|nr:hypothetical protein CTP10_R32360 [Cupriavidus sp. P-10]
MGRPRLPVGIVGAFLGYSRAMESESEKRSGFLVTDVGRLCGKRFDDLPKSTLDLTRTQCRALAYLAAAVER